jgi:hypothetical protein
LNNTAEAGVDDLNVYGWLPPCGDGASGPY